MILGCLKYFKDIVLKDICKIALNINGIIISLSEADLNHIVAHFSRLPGVIPLLHELAKREEHSWEYSEVIAKLPACNGMLFAQFSLIKLN